MHPNTRRSLRLSMVCYKLNGKGVVKMKKSMKRLMCGIRFCLPPAHRGIIKQTASHAVRIAILPTRTMDADRIRALIPTFSWETPQWRPFGHMTCEQALSYAFPQITLESCSSLRLRASSRAHSQCAQPSSFITSSVQTWPRPVITHPQQTKTNDMKL